MGMRSFKGEKDLKISLKHDFSYTNEQRFINTPTLVITNKFRDKKPST